MALAFLLMALGPHRCDTVPAHRDSWKSFGITAGSVGLLATGNRWPALHWITTAPPGIVSPGKPLGHSLFLLVGCGFDRKDRKGPESRFRFARARASRFVCTQTGDARASGTRQKTTSDPDRPSSQRFRQR